MVDGVKWIGRLCIFLYFIIYILLRRGFESVGGEFGGRDIPVILFQQRNKNGGKQIKPLEGGDREKY